MTTVLNDDSDGLPSGIDKTVVKALALFERLVELGRPAGVTELALAAGLQKSNVHRTLSALRFMGYVRSTPDGLYEPTLHLWELGQHIHSRIDIVYTARPFLRKLVQETDETGHLAILDGAEIVYVDKVESANPVRVYTVLGGRAPAYCTASGKALLSGQSSSALMAIASRAKKITSSTLTKIDELQRAISQVRERGYAFNIGEFHDNVAGLAAPVMNRRGDIVASVGISGPLDRLKPSRMRQLAPLVMGAAKGISGAIGASA